jgi:hypothetical protein
MGIHPSEKAFFEVNNSKEKVINNLRIHQQNILNTTWELYPLPNIHIPPELLTVAQEAITSAGNEMVKQLTNSLLRKSQGAVGEVLTRLLVLVN